MSRQINKELTPATRVSRMKYGPKVTCPPTMITWEL